jgi:SRSO17 transposase
MHRRWAIEQQYQELKSELGFDHFEGRTGPGWQHHAVLTAVAHAYIQRERIATALPDSRFRPCAPSCKKSSPRCCLRRNRGTCIG